MINKQKNRNFRVKKNTRHSQGHSRKMQSGQILVIVVFAIVGLVAFVGLVVDTGLVFVGNGRLRRATDAAALAAAAAYRQYPDSTRLNQVAMEYLTLNQVDNAGATIHLLCDPSDLEYDATQCTPAKRRLVKVDTTTVVHLAFMPVLGIRTVTLNATATSEAASLDIVLAMDVSESMTFDSGANSLMLDPSECNDVASVTDYTACEPFEKIQHAAVDFVTNLITNDNSYDRIAVIPFDRLAHHTKSGQYNDPLYLSDNAGLTPAQYRVKIVNEIKGLRVFTGSGSASTGGPLGDGSCLNGSGNLQYPSNTPCRNYQPNFDGYCFDSVTGLPIDLNNAACFTPTPPAVAPQTYNMGPYTTDGINFYQRTYHLLICPPGVEPRYCGTTNTGGAFNSSGNEFVRPGAFRQESLWVVIMLTDGIANHTDGNLYCPNGDGTNCQDPTVATISNGSVGRHCQPSGDSLYTGNPFLFTSCNSAPPDGGGGAVNSASYDADDYARDMADFVALGQQALIYTIGFGNDMHHGDPTSSGEQLLNYAADIGDDGKVNTPAGTLNSNYFYAPNATQLGTIFTTITQRIATRLTH
jgi:Flp pilus assembly protein TadG